MIITADGRPALARVRVEPLRDPDTAEILGWLAQCQLCRGYLTGDRDRMLTAAHRHPCSLDPREPLWREL